jgi:hypothetical protein
MSRYSEWLWNACAALGLRVELGFRLALPGDRELIAVARVADLGAHNGMLLFRSYDEIKSYAQDLLALGYGYSVIDEPRSDEVFDIESFKEMFRDWGWTGGLGQKPKWMR